MHPIIRLISHITHSVGKLRVAIYVNLTQQRTVNDAKFELLANSQGKLWLIECA